MTAQISESLSIDGEIHEMTYCPPLPPDTSLLSKTETIMVEVARADGGTSLEVREQWIDRDGVAHVETSCFLTGSTACWRGYVGTWKIEDNRLWLVELIGRFRLAVPGPVFADWVTGVLRVPRGELLDYVHMGFGSVYEEELHIAVERGEVRGRRIYDNRTRDHDVVALGWANLPGRENSFPGDRDFN